MLKKLLSLSGRKKRSEEFENVMSRAKVIYGAADAVGLTDLIRIVLRPIQAKHISDAYLRKPKAAIQELFWNSAFGFSGYLPGEERTFIDIIWSDDCLVRDKSVYPQVNLASDITLPTCWEPQSLTKNLGSIGEGLRKGPFKQSDTNHDVMFSYPFNVGWVARGNHSITQAILRGHGEVIPKELHDYSFLLETIRYDGFDFRSIDTDEILGRPVYREFGWMWEIGRAITRLQESPYKKVLQNQRAAKDKVA